VSEEEYKKLDGFVDFQLYWLERTRIKVIRLVC
jgi:hypothetical protein